MEGIKVDMVNVRLAKKKNNELQNSWVKLNHQQPFNSASHSDSIKI